jgi:hypothetical protein
MVDMTAALDPSAFISAALAPVLGVSGSAILASQAQTKYSALVDRIRSLHSERRALAGEQVLNAVHANRIRSLERQVALLVRRARHLRDALFLLYVAIGFLIVTSVALAAVQVLPGQALWFLWTPRVTFLAGLTCVFASIVHDLLEVRLAFRVVALELELFDDDALREAERRFREV